MNRQLKNIDLRNNGRNQVSQENLKNKLKPNRSEYAEIGAKTINRLSKSSTTITNTTKQKLTVPKNENNSKNHQTNIKASSAINLTSYGQNKEYENRIPEKKVFGLRDIQRQDFFRENISFDLQRVMSPASNESVKTLPSTKLIQTAKKGKNEEPLKYNTSKFNVTTPKSDKNTKNVVKKNKFLEREILKKYDFNKKKQIVINILKKVRENNIKSNKKLIGGKMGNREQINKNSLIPVTRELMQSLNLEPSDISILLKILQYKPPVNNNIPPPIKFSQEPFVKLKKMDKKECSVKKTLDIKTTLKTQNTNLVNEIDCFISKVKRHFVDKSLYHRERRPVILVPSLGTITEELEPEAVH